MADDAKASQETPSAETVPQSVVDAAQQPLVSDRTLFGETSSWITTVSQVVPGTAASIEQKSPTKSTEAARPTLETIAVMPVDKDMRRAVDAQVTGDQPRQQTQTLARPLPQGIETRVLEGAPTGTLRDGMTSHISGQPLAKTDQALSPIAPSIDADLNEVPKAILQTARAIAAPTQKAPPPIELGAAPVPTEATKAVPTFGTSISLESTLPALELSSMPRLAAAEQIPLSPFATNALRSANFAQQTIQSLVASYSRANDGTIDIRLDPPELGRIALKIVATEFGAQAQVTAERAEIVDVLRRNENILQKELADAGFSNIDLNFAHAENSDDAESDEAQHNGNQVEVMTSSDIAPAARADTGVAGSLDIRL